MSEFEKLSKDLDEKVTLCGAISENILQIDYALAPIRVLKGLSANPAVFDHSTFKGQSSEQLTEYLVNCVKTMTAMKKEMKRQRDQLEGLGTVYVCDDTPDSEQLVSEVCDLKSKFDDFVVNQPKPADYATAVVAKLPQTKSKPVNNVNIRKEVKQASEEQIRSSNLIIYRVAYNKDQPMRPSDCAKVYFESCGVALFHLECDKIVDAQYLSVSRDQTTCNIKVMMTNPMVVRSLLSVSKQLKTSDKDKFCDTTFDFTKTYVEKDRTKSEQEHHRKLISEMKLRISEDPNTRWIIKFGRIQAGGSFK